MVIRPVTLGQASRSFHHVGPLSLPTLMTCAIRRREMPDSGEKPPPRLAPSPIDSTMSSSSSAMCKRL